MYKDHFYQVEHTSWGIIVNATIANIYNTYNYVHYKSLSSYHME